MGTKCKSPNIYLQKLGARHPPHLQLPIRSKSTTSLPKGFLCSIKIYIYIDTYVAWNFLFYLAKGFFNLETQADNTHGAQLSIVVFFDHELVQVQLQAIVNSSAVW